MENSTLKGAVEALIFASEGPIKIEKLIEILSDSFGEDCDRPAVKDAIAEIKSDCEAGARGTTLTEIAGGFQFRTKSEYAPLLLKLKAKRPPKFGRAAMEVLSIVAYRQPITRAEIDELRGVDSGGVLRSLLEKNLCKIMGKKEVPGKPIIYGTAKFFLEHFGLRDLGQLPSLKEFVELEKEEEAASS